MESRQNEDAAAGQADPAAAPQRKRQKKQPRPTPEQLEKAEALRKQSGIPKMTAIRVAMGRLTLNEAIRELMMEERIAKLQKKHGISRTDASKVARGKLTIEDVALIQELQRSPARQPDRNVLEDLLQAGRTGTICCFGRDLFRARVESVSNFACRLQPAGDQSGPDEDLIPSGRLQKVEILLVAPDATPTELEPRLGLDPEVAALELGTSFTYRDRFRSSKRVLHRHYRDRLRTRVTFRDGRQIEGWVGWHGKWEFQLLPERPPADPAAREPLFTEAPGQVVVFRHAMHRLEALD